LPAPPSFLFLPFLPVSVKALLHGHCVPHRALLIFSALAASTSSTHTHTHAQTPPPPPTHTHAHTHTHTHTHTHAHSTLAGPMLHTHTHTHTLISHTFAVASSGEVTLFHSDSP